MTQPYTRFYHSTSFLASTPSTQTSFIVGNDIAALKNNNLAPSRSWIAAECTTTANNNPNVSIRICRLRPLIFFPASYPWIPLFPSFSPIGYRPFRPWVRDLFPLRRVPRDGGYR